MEKFKNWERLGLKDFLNSNDVTDLIISIAKIVSKNLLNPQTNSDAIDVILLHSTTAESILNRKSITKEILFKYLHSKKVPVTSDFTKQLLIEKILQYWKQSFYLSDDEYSDDNKTQQTATSSIEIQSTHPINPINNSDQPEYFPINQMARKFAAWFYENLNTNQLQMSDFWSDCKCMVNFLEHQQCLMQEEHFGSEAVLNFCQSLLSKYNLYLNLNISHSGTQGRIDCHGIVLVLTCGTLHKINQFVGTFEMVFGLSRDPFSQNNWKINQINLRLHNFNADETKNASITFEQPTLLSSNSMAPLLCLSMPNGNDEIG